MPINLVARGFKHFRFVIRLAGGDVLRCHHPNTHTLHPPRVHIARMLQSLLRIGRMKTATMLVLQALLGADENFKEREFFCHGLFELCNAKNAKSTRKARKKKFEIGVE